MRTKIALAIYLIIGLIDLVLGVIYFTSDQFLSYHSQAVGTSWQEVDFGTQTLILALMRVAGGGWLALGFLTIAFALSTLMRSSTLARWLLPTGTVIFYLPCLAATWSVYRETGAQSPWAPTLALIVFALVALLIDAPWSSRNRGKD